MKRIIAALAACACVGSAQAAEEKIPIESFFKLSQYAAMVLSPDGKHIAATAPAGQRQNLVIIDLEKRKATPITRLTQFDVVNPRWVNNRRLLYSTTQLGERAFDARAGGLFAIDLDGSYLRVISGAGSEGRPLRVVRVLPGDSDEVIAQEGGAGQESISSSLYRLDTRTGIKTNISVGKPDTASSETWIMDRNGVPRVFSAASEMSSLIYYRAGPDAPWQKLDEVKQLSPESWTPVGLAEDGRTLYVSSYKGRDKAAIFRYDPATKTFGELVAQHPQVDLTAMVSDRESVRGVVYNADRPGVAWFDEGLAAIQSMVDKALPDNVNLLNWSSDRNLVLIRSFSDVLPGAFYLLDRKAGKLEWLADSRPWIDPKKMSPMQPVRYKARDGLEIPAYLTVPRGSSGKSLPLVVVVHGGPWVDGDSWNWDPEVQFLASRGYAVLQPNFRGTTHYGWKHFSSSFKQYGLAMQDDITDAANWATAQGIADPKRLCIYGASYGGYAAMMGVAKTPDLFKCAINYIGVTDLPLRLTASWSDSFNSDFAQHYLKTLIGDADRDIERLKATSPVYLAAQIKAPVLMAYGGVDVRVVPQHGTRMKAALESAGNKPEWIMVNDEGHGYRALKNQVMFYGAMEKFLEKNIGGSP